MDDDPAPHEPHEPREPFESQQHGEPPPTPSNAVPQPEAHEHVEQGAPPIAQAPGAGSPPGAQATAEAPPGVRERGPRVEIGIAEGDLRVVGGAEHVMLRQPRHADASVAPQDRGGTLYFARVADGTELQVPDGVEVELREVRGDLSVHAVDGWIEVGHVGGDVTLDGITAARLVRVRGDLRAANAGDVELREVGGDADGNDTATDHPHGPPPVARFQISPRRGPWNPAPSVRFR